MVNSHENKLIQLFIRMSNVLLMRNITIVFYDIGRQCDITSQ